MKKIIALTSIFLLVGFVAFAQNAEKTANLNKNQKTSSCKPMSPEQCAAKMGISLAEYIALPKKSCNNSTTASVDNKTSNVLPIVAVSNMKTTEKKCCSSLEECAKKMGMTVEECKAKCTATKTSRASTTTKIAAKNQE